MYRRIESVLGSLGLTESYLNNFKDNAMDDDTLEMCFERESDLGTLKDIIPLAGHRMKFVRAFREQLAGTGGQTAGRNASKPNPPSSTGQAATFSAGPAGDYGSAGNATGAFGAAYKPPPAGNELAGSMSFGAFSSGQASSGSAASRFSVLNQPGQAGQVNPELVKSFSNLGFGPDPSAVNRTLLGASGGNGAYQPPTSSGVDGFKNFRVQLQQPLIPSLTRPRSVQIMEFEEVTKGNAIRKTVFYEEEFRRVIDKCDPSRPVAVLAVAGKANKGKSLFLSYVLRYLKALQQGNEDWLGWNDTTIKPLDGFRWANGYEVVTKGIWTWSEPITCKNSKGQEFDVLLMDTQGVFDEKTGEREWAILAGMGLLTSSVMVLNTSNDVQEDTLKSLQNFLSFGLLALDRDDSSVSAKPFQNLVFLVRDWENHEEFPFGNEGGRKFIEKKLEEKPDHDDFHRRLRRQMRTCFEDIDCFLFPYPGLATRERSFTGSVVNATPEYRAFAKQMQLCIEKLVDNFPLKTLNGNVIMAPDVFEMFKSYIEIFNSDQLPSSNDLYNAAAERCNVAIVSKCVDHLVKTFESSLSSVSFLNEKDFRRTQENAEEEAMALFRKSRKMGDSQVISAAKAELMSKLGEKVSHYRSVNQNKLAQARHHFETKVREITAEFEAELQSKLGDDVLYEDVFDDIHSQVASNARQKFQDLQCDPTLESEVLPILTKQIQNTDKWLHLIKLNKERAEQSLQAAVADAEREYRNSLDPSKFTDVEDLETAAAEARLAALETVKSFPHKLRESTVNKAQTELTTQLDALYEKAREQVEKNCEAEQRNLELAIEDGVKQYKESMDALILSRSPTKQQKDSPVSSEDLDDFHQQSESEALETLTEFFKINSQKFKNVTDLELESKKKLRDRITKEFTNFKDRNDQKSENVKAQVVKYLSEAQQEFTDEMKRVAHGIDDEATLNSKVSELRSRIKSEFENCVDKSIADAATLRDHLARLDSHIDDLASQYATVIEMKRKEDEVSVQGAMADARIFYSDQMKTARESKSWYTTEEFKKINDKVLEETVKKFSEEGAMTPEQTEGLRQSLLGLYTRFEEENDSFIPKDSHAIGIDLGTTYSCVGIYMNGKVEIIQENEKFTIPSCVYYDEGNKRAVGEAAQDGAFRSPEDFVFDAKRLIGRSWNDKIVQDDIQQWNFNVIEVDSQPRIKCRGGVLRPEEVSAEVLAHLKSLAEKHLGQKVTSAVVTVPAYFNEGQRQATKDAATMAGLTAKILTEPVAAAIAYRLDRAGDLNKNVLVFDLGGGTFDVAVLTITGGNIDVKTINGDTHLGGEDFDKAVVKHVIDKVKANTGRDLLEGKNSSDPDTKKKVNNLLRRLKLECERKKRDLSSVQMVHIRLEDVGGNLDETLMRNEFENLIEGDLEKCMDVVKTALKDAKMSKSDIDDIVLVGGSTKIPKVHEMLKDYFNGIQLKHTVNPDQAVAYGAAIQAAIKGGTSQGNGLRNRITVEDCTPSSIGIEDANETFVVQIPKGQKIPHKHQQFWWPVRDYQSSCDYNIYEGEDTTAKSNHFLGKFVLHLPSVRKEEAKMESTTEIDDEGILTVKAVCLMDGNEKDIRIDAYKGRMSKEEIDSRRTDITQRRA